MLKKILIGLVGLVVGLVLIAFVLPQEVHVERSVTINAPAEAIYPWVASLRKNHEWSPWAEMDPDAKYTYEGPEEGVGAKVSWVGNDQVGEGTQEITEAIENRRVTTALDFGEHGTAVAYFDLAPEGEGTTVTWGFDTDLGMDPIGRWMGLTMDAWIGPDYEKGLAKLKALVESPPANT